MKKSVLVVVGALAIATTFAGQAWSEEGYRSELAQPISIAGAAADQGPAPTYPPAASPSPSNAPPVSETPPDAVQAAGPAPDPGPQPWHLPQPCLLQNLGINVGGWVQQGINFNSREPADGFNGPVTINDFDRQYQLNQAWLYFVRPTKTDGCGVDIGGRVDVVYGTDWRYGQCEGLEDLIDGANNFYGLVLPQFYGEVAVNNLTVKIGHFATMTSYEAVPAPLNFFYSHSYLMAGYFDPLLVTGVQADYKLNDNWVAIGGLNRGWLKFEDVTDDWNFLGGVKWASDSKRATMSLMVDTGRQLGFNGGLNDRSTFISYFTYQISERLQYAGQYNIGKEDNGAFPLGGADAEWYGTAQYLFYKLNKKWSLGARYEVVRDDDGARIAGIGNLLGTNKGWLGAPGFAGDFYELSFGVNWRPNLNMVLRPEIRWDWYDGPANPAGQLPFGNFNRSSQFLAAMDLVITF